MLHLMSVRAAAALLALLGLTACAEADRDAAAVDDDGHVVTIEHTYEPAPSGPLYTEGALSEVVVTDAAGSSRTLRGDFDAPIVFEGLEPGDYVVQPGLRPCSGNCEASLDPRTDTCSVAISVPAVRTVRVRYVPTQPCRATADEAAEEPANERSASGGPFVLQDPGPRTGPDRRGWDSARTDGADAILVSFIGPKAGRGPCQADYEGSARLDGEAVVVDVRQLPSEAPPSATADGAVFGCTLEGYTRTVRVVSPVPLKGRRVIDARTGQPGALLDGGALPRPASVPPGSEPEPQEGGTGGDEPVWQSIYRSGPDDPILGIYWAAPGWAEERTGEVVARTQVRGQPAAVHEQRDGDLVVIREIAWTEAGGSVVVQSLLTRVDAKKPVLTAEELIVFAQSFR